MIQTNDRFSAVRTLAGGILPWLLAILLRTQGEAQTSQETLLKY